MRDFEYSIERIAVNLRLANAEFNEEQLKTVVNDCLNDAYNTGYQHGVDIEMTGRKSPWDSDRITHKILVDMNLLEINKVLNFEIDGVVDEIVEETYARGHADGGWDT